MDYGTRELNQHLVNSHRNTFGEYGCRSFISGSRLSASPLRNWTSWFVSWQLTKIQHSVLSFTCKAEECEPNSAGCSKQGEIFAEGRSIDSKIPVAANNFPFWKCCVMKYALRMKIHFLALISSFQNRIIIQHNSYSLHNVPHYQKRKSLKMILLFKSIVSPYRIFTKCSCDRLHPN